MKSVSVTKTPRQAAPPAKQNIAIYSGGDPT